MSEGITLKRIIDMDEATELTSSDYALVDSATGGPKKFALGDELSSLKKDFDDITMSVSASAAQIETNKQDISTLKDEVRPLFYLDGLYINTSNNKWSVDVNSHYTFVPINPNGTIYLKAKPNSSCFYCLFKTNNVIVNTTPDYATGYGIGFNRLTANQETTINVPADGYYLAYLHGYEPYAFTIDGISYDVLYPTQSFRERIATLEDNSSDLSYVKTAEELLAVNSLNPKAVYIEKGAEIVLSEQCYIPDSTIVIGNGATIKRADGYDGLLIRLGNNCKLSGLNINGNRENTSSPTWDATSEIRIAGNKCVVEDVNIVNGNEAIIVYGDDVAIKHCILTNCGGNGIHFSGAVRTAVENCTIIGANKTSGMGHEDGCIIWSNACEYQICTGNWCEDGISGFGSIDSVDNANIKLVGNTVKNCTYAVEAHYTSLQPSNVEITNNQFINNGALVIRRVAEGTDDGTTPAMVNVLIANNIFVKTSIDCRHLKRLTIENNIVDLGNIAAVKCPYCVIRSNTVESDSNHGVVIDTSYGAAVSGNSIIANLNAIYAGDANNATITGNSLRVRILGTNNYPSSPCIYTNGAVGIIVSNNTILSLYGLYLYAESIVTGNIVKCRLNGETAIGASSGVSGNVKDNIYYGTFRPEQGEGINVDSNVVGSAPATYSVACALTNIEPVAVDAVWALDSLLITLVPQEGYTLPESITVSVGGKVLPVITQDDYVNVPNGYTYDKTTGTVRIPSVMNYVNISATGVAA